jgi:hypothetical protein
VLPEKKRPIPAKRIFEKPEKKLPERPKTFMIPKKSNLPQVIPVKEKKPGIFTGSERQSIIPLSTAQKKKNQEDKQLYDRLKPALIEAFSKQSLSLDDQLWQLHESTQNQNISHSVYLTKN